MQRGIYILCIGDKSYAHWAVNLAASVKFYSPDLSITLIHDEAAEAIRDEERHLFDHFTPINPGYTKDEAGNFAPGVAKLHLYEYFQHEENLYLDADSILIREIDSLFDKFKDKDFSTQVIWKGDLSSGSWNCIWMKWDDITAHYKLPETYNIFEINSSVLYSKKNPTAEAFWKQALDNVLHNYKSKWGKSFPDELAFDIAFAQTGLNPDTGVSIVSTDSKIEKAPQTLGQLEKQYYMLTFWGGKNSGTVRHYQNYDMLAMQINRKVLGRHNPYKHHFLMGKKYVQTHKSPPAPKVDHREALIKAALDSVSSELDFSQSILIDSRKLLQFHTHQGKNIRVTNWLNGSILQYKGKTLFAYRMECAPWFKYLRTAICELDESSQPIEGTNKMLDLSINGSGFEDPRLFINSSGQLSILYTDGQKMAKAVLTDTYDTVEKKYLIPPARKGGTQHDGREKNWVPFLGSDSVIYNCNAEHVIAEYPKYSPENEKNLPGVKWEYGTIRGGAPAIKHNGVYYHFFHSSIPINGIQWGRQYVMGCYTFDESGQILSISSKPILKAGWLPLSIGRPANSVMVVFPAGVIRESDGFRISFGSNDYENRVIKVTDETLNRNLCRIKN